MRMVESMHQWMEGLHVNGHTINFCQWLDVSIVRTCDSIMYPSEDVFGHSGMPENYTIKKVSWDQRASGRIIDGVNLI